LALPEAPQRYAPGVSGQTGLFPETQPPEGAGFARVAPERGIDRPEGLTYRIPAEMADLQPGERVRVPLGSGGRSAFGVVVTIDDAGAIDPRRIKPIERRTGVRIPGVVLDLGRWIAAYYCCPLGMTLHAMTPAAVKKGTGLVRSVALEPSGAEPIVDLPPKTRAAWERIRAMAPTDFPLAPRALASAVGATSRAPLTRLVRLGLLREVQVSRVRSSGWAQGTTGEAPAPPSLTPAQRKVVDDVGASLGAFGVHVLRGVTGSGKTEVYLHLIERVLEQGRCAIVLVPEISLTPQASTRYTGRFGADRVAILHSGLSAAQRNSAWSRIASGGARVAIGARSAIFSPFEAANGAPVGLIVVDEEHDSAYKQEDQPRYHARDVAVRRAQLEGCPVLLGSATPSLESWRNARLGRAALHELPARVGGAMLPRVKVVDLRDEMRRVSDPHLRDALLGPTLLGALADALGAGGQAILLLNRRGFASHIRCADINCGWVMQCDHCDASMVAHRGKSLPPGGVVRCHHCDAAQKVPTKCPICAKGIVLLGAGSQRVEQELPRIFPDLVEGQTLLRMDSDTMRSARHYFESLERFERGEIRVLVGTQVLAKGLDFPNVSLVGVVSADTALALPDFRATERTFQLVSQVAGRSGRAAGRPGLVVVQTVHPAQPAIRLAARHDYTTFADAELAIRERAGLPPVTRMARIVCRDEDAQVATDRAEQIALALRALDSAERLEVHGPAPCALGRVNERYRVGVELVAPSAAGVQRALAAVRAQGLVRSDSSTAVDVDPITLL
jgi:primosomal protein N' (replication factor Y)